MLNIIQNTIGAIRRVGESVVRAGLKMWLPFTTADHLGREVVSDNSFNDTNEWIKESGWTVSDGLATRTNVGSYSALQQHCLVSGTTYQVTIVIDSITSGELFGVRLGTNYIITDKSSANTYQGIGVANSTLLSIMGEPNFAGTISSISIKEATQISTDISSNENDAILKTGKALQFTGNDSVETSFPSTTPIRTIAFWVKPTHSSTNETLFYGGGAYANTRQIYLDHLKVESINGNMIMNTYVNGQYEGVTFAGTPATLTQDEWQRVVLATSETAPIFLYSDDFDIGSGEYGSDGRFIISDLQIYDKAWTTDDIAYDYANPQKLVTDSEDTSITLDNLKAWWHLSEGDGTIAFDSAPLIGKELVVNGDFSTDSDWFEGVGWDIENEKGVATSVPSGQSLSQSSSIISGVLYKVTYTVLDFDEGGVYVRVGNLGIGTTRTGNGTYTETIEAAGNSTIYFTGYTNSTTLKIGNVSVKEVYNIDGETYDGSSLGASYVDAQERIPQLGMMNWSKGSNLITYSEDLTEWTLGSNATLTYESDVVAPDGTVGVYRLLLPAQNSTFIKSPTYAAGSGRVFSMWVKKTNNNNSQFNFYDGSTSPTTFTATDEWQRFEMNGQAGTNAFVLNLGDTFISDIYIWGGQVESGTTASAYRRTNGSAVTDATLIASATDSQKDILGNAVRIKGSGFNLDGTGYGEVLDDASINPTTAITIGCWVYFEGNKNDLGIVGKWETSKTDYLITQIFDGSNRKLRFYIETTDGRAILSSPAIIGDKWVYVACTYNKDAGTNNTKIYTIIPGNLDGSGNQIIEKRTGSLTGSINDSDNNITIGQYNYTGSTFFDNKIDDVKIYNTDLSEAQIEQNYNATKTGHNN